MSIASFIDSHGAQRISLTPASGPLQSLYKQLMDEPEPGHPQAREFLLECLQEVAELPCELPQSPYELADWSTRQQQRVTQDYADYLNGRHAGEGRRYFPRKADALHFLRAVAPTKLVDGAWLYGVLPHWRDYRVYPLVRTYLDELGDGVASQNHALLYRRLLASEGCEDILELDDGLYRQGAIQLALGLLAEEFLPEVIGYNLGHEQLPLDMLISAYELKELDIDTYYFQLHMNIDSGSGGHAAKAVQSVLTNLPRTGDAQAFYQRVMRGYMLNRLGMGSTAVIDSFDLHQQVLQMLEQKRTVASQMHSDYFRIAGRTVNQWLCSSDSVESFLQALQHNDWIRRDTDPACSRFWRLIQGPGAAMFGMFSPYERQLLHDWIAGSWQPEVRAKPFRPRRRYRAALSLAGAAQPGETGRDLIEELQNLDAYRREFRLIALQAPGQHWSNTGLAATRAFAALIQ
ncbi:MAG: iron-containing redox enzyme family protein [Pseudomonas sp.]|nr:iron-containing redox enzyme family protein [Pseudomonas sp.]